MISESGEQKRRPEHEEGNDRPARGGRRGRARVCRGKAVGHEEAPLDADETVAFPLKNKYADYSRGESEPVYVFELETPNGTKELRASAEQYDTYYIGDEVVCRETGGGLAIV